MKTQTQPIARLVCAAALIVTALAAAGCSSEKRNWTGPARTAKVTIEPWQYGDNAGRILRTSHYLIHTTIADDDVLERLPQVMEGAHAQYEAFVPVAPTTRDRKSVV